MGSRACRSPVYHSSTLGRTLWLHNVNKINCRRSVAAPAFFDCYPGMVRTFFHVDMDAFFVSVEELYDPTLRSEELARKSIADGVWRPRPFSIATLVWCALSSTSIWTRFSSRWKSCTTLRSKADRKSTRLNSSHLGIS